MVVIKIDRNCLENDDHRLDFWVPHFESPNFKRSQLSTKDSKAQQTAQKLGYWESSRVCFCLSGTWRSLHAFRGSALVHAPQFHWVLGPLNSPPHAPKNCAAIKPCVRKSTTFWPQFTRNLDMYLQASEIKETEIWLHFVSCVTLQMKTAPMAVWGMVAPEVHVSNSVACWCCKRVLCTMVPVGQWLNDIHLRDMRTIFYECADYIHTYYITVH